MTATKACKTPLYQQHIALNARMVDFHGWALPLHYGSQLAEHQQVRTAAGLFDVSHMTVTDIIGSQARALLRTLLANDIDRLGQTGQALYSCMLNPEGGVIDDLLVYLLAPGQYRIISNSTTRRAVVEWITNNCGGLDITLEPRPELAILALQGPAAARLLATALPQLAAAETLPRFYGSTIGDCFISRTGYTGEDGFELLTSADTANRYWAALIAAGVSPAGLGARDTLRLEAGFSLYGQDLDSTHTPFDSGLSWTVNLTDPTRAFIGRAALERQLGAGPTQRFVGIVLQQRGVLRPGLTVTTAEGDSGQLTSGGFSPTLQQAIGLARLPIGDSTACQITIRRQEKPATVVKLPFVRSGKTVPLTPELTRTKESCRER